MLVIAWHLLATGTDYRELGADYFARRDDAKTRERHVIRQLEVLGHRSSWKPAA